jgi:hypothetical protein
MFKKGIFEEFARFLARKGVFLQKVTKNKVQKTNSFGKRK